MSKPPVRTMSKEASKTLRAIGEETFGTDEQGRSITKIEQAQRLAWRLALGWVEESRDTNGSLRKVTHPPDQSWLKFVIEHQVGKPGTSQVEEKKGLSAAAEVRKLAVERLNRLAEKNLA